jgi:hypothetical protein
MKHVYKKLVLLVVFSLFFIDYCCAEGFAPGTLIKVPAGYVAIESLHIGDCAVCYDADKNIVEGTISCITRKTVDAYVRIAIADEHIYVACDQLLYDENCDVWIVAALLKNGDILAGHTITVEFVNTPIDLYLLSVAQHHNFFVTKSDVCAHNFFPPIVLAITGVFGGGLEIAGCSFGVAGLGSFLGYQWHKKNKQKHEFVVQMDYGGGMMPEDPEDEKRRKRTEALNDFQPLTNKEAQSIAKEFGHRKVKDHPCGNTRNKPVFFNGKNYISPDIDGHNGGLWKVFDRRGNILYTMTRRFEEIVKVYKA